MKKLTRSMSGLILFLALGVQAASSAFETVQTATDQLLRKLVEIGPLYETDRESFFREVDASLAPFIDFEGFSRGVMAKYYRRASPEQKARFSESFRIALIRTYAKALVEFDNQEIIVKGSKENPKKPGKARVSLEVHGKNGTVYPVEYSLVNLDGQWKLRNVVIDGINIGLQFRSQFASYMARYNNSIDEVIEHWNVDVSV